MTTRWRRRKDAAGRYATKDTSEKEVPLCPDTNSAFRSLYSAMLHYKLNGTHGTDIHE